jgi:2-keto-3-deoxy-L-rhamnonate aldolase RhmA
MRPNAMKERLAAGRWSAGAIIPVADAQLVEVCGLAGWDHVLIDAEHGHISVQDCENLVRAAHAVNITPIVRVPTNAPHEILRYLDTGAQGVMVPQVNTRDDAERAAAAARYHPKGARGLAGTRAATYGMREPLGKYAEMANANVLVLALIEDIRAVENLPDILAVEGIDVLSIGPADLSQSMGYPGERDHPTVREAIAEIIRQGVAAGKPVGMNVPTGVDAAREHARGVRVFSVNVWGLLAQSTATYMAALEKL